MSYANPEPGEREKYIDAYIQRRQSTYDKRLPRYNGKGRGRAPKGTISVHSSLRKRATISWNKKIKRAQTRNLKKSIDKL